MSGETELLNLLTQDKSHASISPESLELMGKQAANMYLDEGVALNEAVVKIASEHSDINQEQLSRICEFANTSVYLAKHDQAKTAGAEHSYPQFQLADPARVIQDMTDGARPTVVTQTDVAYGKHPNRSLGISPEAAEAILEGLFGVHEAEKHSSLDYTRDSALGEIMDAKHNLQDLRSSLQSSAQQLDGMHKQASDEYYDTVKRHLLDGGSFADVVVAGTSSGLSYEKYASAIQPFVTQLLREKVASAAELSNDMDGLEKVAHRIINEQHPLVASFRAYIGLDYEIEKIATGLVDVEKELKNVDSFIRETFGAETH
jgi:hypothetical protein